MNKLFTKIAVVSAGFALAIGVGAAALSRNSFAETKAADKLSYTLDGTQTTANEDPYNAYAKVSEITQNTVSWNVVGNTSINPWRIGGKNLSATDRAIYSTSPIADNIYKVEVASGTTNAGTLHSLTISVHSTAADAQNGTNAIATKVEDTAANITSKTVTLTKADSTSWAGKYYRIVYNLTIGGSNKYVQFISAKFTSQIEVVAPDTVTVTGENALEVGETTTLTATATKSGSSEGVNQNVSWSSSDETVAWVSETGVVTGVSNGSATIRATSEDSALVYGELAVTVSGGKTDNSALVMTANSGFDTSYGDKYVAISGMYIHYDHVMKGSNGIQFQKSTALLENVAKLPADIGVIEFTFNAEKEQGTGYTVSVSADGSSFTVLDANVLYENTAYYSPASSGMRYFKVTAPTAGTLYVDEILVGLNNANEQKGVTLSASLNTKLDTLCKGDSDTAAVTASEWAEVKAIYDGGDADAKAFLAGVDGASYIRVNRFLERYDYIVTTYGHENFLGRTLSSPAMNNVNNANTMIVVIVISVISTISLAGLAALLVLKKRKQY